LITFTSKIEIKNNWRIEFRTTPTDMRFETNPYLDFGPIRIPIKSIVEPIVKEQINNLTKDIDSELASIMDLSSTIDSVWRELHEPQLLDSALKAWLCITPSQVLLSPLRSNNEHIRIMAGFRGIIKVVTGEKPVVSDIRPLPLITLTEQINQDFNIFVESHIGLQEASEIARSHLKDTVFEFGSRRSVKIEDIAFAGYGSKVYTKVDLSQSIRGSVYFIGTPAYNRELKEVYFKDFDFELRTRNALHKSAGWLMHGTFKRAIEKEFRYNIADDLKEIHNMVDNTLKDYDFAGLFTLNGRLNSIDIHDIIVEYNTLRLIVDVKGRALINVNSLDF